MAGEYGRRGLAGKGLALAAVLAGVRAGRAAVPIKLLTLGDSLTAGYGLPPEQGFETQLRAALARAGVAVTIEDGGVSGDTSAGGRARLDWLLADGPAAAIVELGGNDGLRGLSVAQMRDNLTAILDRLKVAGIPVLLSGMYPPPNLGAEYTKDFRAVFDALGRRPGLIYDPFFLAGVAVHPGLIQADGIHPNAAGVAVVVGRILPLVQQLLRGVKG